MGHGIHIYFKPSRLFNSIQEVYDCICHLKRFSPELMGDFISLDPWCSILDFPFNCFEDSSFPYLKLYTQGHIGILANEIQCRNDIKTICETLGAKDWWTCDECSDDFICDLHTGEFERMLQTRSFEYEKFLMPSFSWPQNCHFIHDSSDKMLIL